MSIQDESNRPVISISMNIRFPHNPTVFVLEAAGTTIPPFHASTSLLVDRNILSFLRRLRSGDAGAKLAAQKWGLGHLTSQALRLNPILAALEGGHQRTPSLSEMLIALEDGADVLQAYFTEAEILTPWRDHPDLVQELLRPHSANVDRDVRYLTEAAHLILDRPSLRMALERRAEIVDLALGFGIPLTDLLVLCVLSCLYEGDDGGPSASARRVLKPKRDMRPAEGYNAVADLRMLQFLGPAVWVGQGEVGLLTCDRGLAGLWELLRVTEVDLETHLGTVASQPEAFARLTTDEVAQMFDWLRSKAPS